MNQTQDTLRRDVQKVSDLPRSVIANEPALAVVVRHPAKERAVIGSSDRSVDLLKGGLVLRRFRDLGLLLSDPALLEVCERPVGKADLRKALGPHLTLRKDMARAVVDG